MKTPPRKKSHYGNKITSLDIPVVGIQYRVGPDTQRELSEQVPLLAKLEREPKNLHDANAIAVRLQESGIHLGYIPRDYAATLAAKIDSEEVLFTSVYVVNLDHLAQSGRVIASFKKKIHNRP